MDLWAQWEGRATNLADPNREQTAESYYTENRAAMDAGAVVYWPEKWPLLLLMRRRAEIGPQAFDTEYQGIPSVEGLTEWPPEYFDKPELWFDNWPPNLKYRVQACDPSKGNDSKTGDYQGHVLAGLALDGILYVEAVLAREPVPQMVARALDMAAQFTPLDTLVVENNDSLGLVALSFRDELVRRATVAPVSHVVNTKPKVQRIRHVGLYLRRAAWCGTGTRGAHVFWWSNYGTSRRRPTTTGRTRWRLAVDALEKITNDPRRARR